MLSFWTLANIILLWTLKNIFNERWTFYTYDFQTIYDTVQSRLSSFYNFLRIEMDLVRGWTRPRGLFTRDCPFYEYLFNTLQDHKLLSVRSNLTEKKLMTSEYLHVSQTNAKGLHWRGILPVTATVDALLATTLVSDQALVATPPFEWTTVWIVTQTLQ